MKFLRIRLHFRPHNWRWYHGLRQYEFIGATTGLRRVEKWFDAFCVSMIIIHYQQEK